MVSAGAAGGGLQGSLCIWQATKPRTVVSAVQLMVAAARRSGANNNFATGRKLQHNKQVLHRIINRHHQPNARAVCCKVLSLLNVSRGNGTATMIFKESLSAGGQI